ncbi:MAG: hypothetical protein IKF82_01040 [Bacilli bacterium]|nr:hypothetical protein [Bacilli bacterium]
MKPLEFKIEKINEDFYMRFYYENGSDFLIQIEQLPDGLELNKHYSIADLYGYKVKDDREGL